VAMSKNLLAEEETTDGGTRLFWITPGQSNGKGSSKNAYSDSDEDLIPQRAIVSADGVIGACCYYSSFLCFSLQNNDYNNDDKQPIPRVFRLSSSFFFVFTLISSGPTIIAIRNASQFLFKAFGPFELPFLLPGQHRVAAQRKQRRLRVGYADTIGRRLVC
jgi:hypothetical protein